VKQGRLVFCVRKSSAADRERLKSLERKERVCGEYPTMMLILMENLGSIYCDCFFSMAVLQTNGGFVQCLTTRGVA
jgi:hypothetical protein